MNTCFVEFLIRSGAFESTLFLFQIRGLLYTTTYSHYGTVIHQTTQRYERDAARLAKHVVGQWKRYVKSRKQGSPTDNTQKVPSTAAVAEDEMHADEATLLLGDG